MKSIIDFVFNKATIVFFLLSLYMMQGTFFTLPSAISLLLALIIMVMGLWSVWVVYAYYPKNPICIGLLILFVFLNIVTFVFSSKSFRVEGGTHEIFVDFRNIMLFLLIPFVTYLHQLKGHIIKDSHYICYGVFLLIISVIRFYYDNLALIFDRGKEENVNNTGYLFVVGLVFLPIIFKKNKILAVIVFVIDFFFIVASAKRGAIVCLGGVILTLLVLIIRTSRISVKTILLISAIIIVVGIFIYYQVVNNDFLMHRFESDSRGRDSHYYDLWNGWLNNASFIKMLIGRGMGQSLAVMGSYAHNDWLELLTSNGLFGVLTYFCLIASMTLYFKNNNFDYHSVLTANIILVIWLLQSLFSMGYINYQNGFFTFVLGALIGSNQYEKYSKRKISNKKLDSTNHISN